MFVLVDGHQWLHRILHVEENQVRFSARGTLVGPADAALGVLCSTLGLFSAQRALVVWDNGLSSRRKALYPEYKENRTAQKSASPTFDYPNAFKWSRSLILRALPLMGIRSLEFVQREGDDLLWLVVQILREMRVRTTIVSEDKDLYSLVCDGVDHYRPVRDLLVTERNFAEKVGIVPERFLLYRALVGDKSDNIAGVAGVGEVTAKRFIEALPPDACWTVAEIVKAASEAKGARTAKIAGAEAVLTRNLALLDVSLEEWTEYEVERARQAVVAPASLALGELRSLVRAEGLAGMDERLASWVPVLERLR